MFSLNELLPHTTGIEKICINYPQHIIVTQDDMNFYSFV